MRNSWNACSPCAIGGPLCGQIRTGCRRLGLEILQLVPKHLSFDIGRARRIEMLHVHHRPPQSNFDDLKYAQESLDSDLIAYPRHSRVLLHGPIMPPPLPQRHPPKAPSRIHEGVIGRTIA